MSQGGFDAFLSYRREDEGPARELVSQLREAGLRIWFDQDQVRPGTYFVDALTMGLQESRTMLLLVGRSGVERWMELEAREAISKSVVEGWRVVPILLPEAEKPDLPPFLRHFQWIDCSRREGFEGPLESIIRSITGHRRTIVRSQIGDELYLRLPGPFEAERQVRVFTLPSPRGDRLLDLTWETFGRGIQNLHWQIRNYGSRLNIDAAIGINDAGMVMSTFLSSSALDLVKIGYLQSRWTDTWHAGEGTLLPDLPENPAILLTDFEVKSGRILRSVRAELANRYHQPRIYFAAFGALVERPDLRIETARDFVAAEELEDLGLDRVFVASIMNRPGIEPPLGLR